MYQLYAEKVDGITEPQGLTNTKPSFSWRLRSDIRGARQVAYRITLTTAAGEPVWDSGLADSSQVHGIPYGGTPLAPDTEYLWQVTSVSSSGDQAVGTDQRFSTGITDVSMWKAAWIEADLPRRPQTDCTDSAKVLRGLVAPPADRDGVMEPCLYFRKSVQLRGEVKRAVAYATAHGIYTLRVNGDEYGDLFAPGYTVYARHQECQRYDVTASLRQGENVLGAVVADGWYTGKIGLMGVGEQYGQANALLIQMRVDYVDGNSELICTDGDFRWSTGGYRYADLFVGEKFDARAEPGGFDSPGYDDSAWRAVIVRDHGYKQLTGIMTEPVSVLREHEPSALLRTPAGELVVDAGENVVGFLRAKLRGRQGQAVSLEYSETLDKDGNFFQNLAAPGQNCDQKDVYVFGADEEVTYTPRFTFHGFQYVRVEGFPDARLEDFTVIVIGSDLELTGRFSCSDERLDRLQQNIVRSQQGNMVSIPTDCPQREKAGWTGDMQIYAPTACFNMDSESFLRKWLYDMRLEQLPNGQIPHVIPDIPSNNYVRSSANASSAGWGDACVIVPYRLYEAYGDQTILADNYPMMLRWMVYVEKQASTEFPDGYEGMSPERQARQKYLWNTGFHFGDWLVPSLLGKGGPMAGAKVTRQLAATAMYAYSTGLMREIASLLGDTKNSEHFGRLNDMIRQAFAEEYVNEDGSLAVHLQGMYVLALQMDLVPPPLRQAAVQNLVKLIDDNGGCLDTGFLSVPFILEVLHANGRPQTAFELLFQTKRPSWLYEVGWGATTLWESWNNITEDGTRLCQSYNHFAFGCVGDFIYRRVLGLQRVSPGYERVKIDPDISCGLTSVSGSMETVFGRISVDWRLDGDRALLRVKLPPNVTAEVNVGKDSLALVESGEHEFRVDL